MSSKKRETESEWMMCRGHSHIHVCITKKSICFSIHSSFFLSHVCFFFLALFFRLSLVLLSSSSSSLSLFVDIRTAMFFVCSMPFTLPCVWVMGKREQETMRGLYNDAKCLYMCALADRLYFLSIYDDDEEDAENARALLLPVYFESTRRFFLVPPLLPVPV